MPTFVQILDFIGTFAFAISGIRLASAKRFDWFGAYVVGLATAIGGGTIRDVLLDVTPGWMTNPIYLICTGLALIWVICFGRWLIRLNNTFFYIRYHRTGFVYGGRCGEKYRFRLSFLGSHHHG